MGRRDLKAWYVFTPYIKLRAWFYVYLTLCLNTLQFHYVLTQIKSSVNLKGPHTTVQIAVKGLKGTNVNQGCLSLNGRSLEITLTVPLILCLLFISK